MPSATTTQAAASNHVSVAKKPGTTPATPPTRMVKVAVWTLRSGEFTELEPPNNTESIFEGGPGEAVIGEDNRKKVTKKDIMPNGKYRSVVKLFLRFAGQDKNGPWAMGTGWLISNDTIVTAGHCAYDWSHKLGRLTHVKAYVGYHGKESIKDTRIVQFRTGKRVAVPQGWLASANNERRDVAFIQVDRPYTGVKPIKYEPTPLIGSKLALGVVGYPGDLMNPESKEKGAFMYEMYHPTTYDIPKSKRKMLYYSIDTYGGNSGGPVFRQKDMASVGVHVLGGNPNSASVISGPYGNPFDALAAALKGKLKRSDESGEEATVDGEEADWLSYVTVPTKEPAPEDETDEATETDPEVPDDSDANVDAGEPDTEAELEEGFFKFLKKALNVAGPMGMIANAGLSVAGKLLGKKKRESSLEEAYSFEGVAERALLGEAALAAVVQLGSAKCKDLGIFHRMLPTVGKLRPICRRAGPAVMPFVMEPAWRMTTTTRRLPTKHHTKKSEADVEPAVEPAPATATKSLTFGPVLDPKTEAFMEALTGSITAEEAEGFADAEFNIGAIIAKAIRIAGPILGSVTETGLARLAVGDVDTEADLDQDPKAEINDPESSAFTYDAMTQRAIAGEAALEAILHTPVETLEQEGLWSKIKGPLWKYGPKFLKVGATVLGGAVGLTEAAVSVADAKKQEKPKDADEDQDDVETGDIDEDETFDGMDPAESAEAEFLTELENGV